MHAGSSGSGSSSVPVHILTKSVSMFCIHICAVLTMLIYVLAVMKAADGECVSVVWLGVNLLAEIHVGRLK